MEQNVASLNLSKTTIARLKELGYNNLTDIESEEVKQKLGFDLDISTLQKAPETNTALEIYNEELTNGCILTYNECLDSVLRDVIIPKTISELAGECGSGKTQVCFQLCVSVQLPKWCGGLEGEAFYIDTNSNFASHRIRELAKEFITRYNSLKPSEQIQNVKFDEASILQHIHYCKVNDLAELISCLKYLDAYLMGKHVRLIVIDSFSFVTRTIPVKDRKTLICKMCNDLRTLARKHNFAVVMTNDLTTRVNKGESYNTPSFGDSFFHLINSRLLLSKKDSSFHAKLEKSVNHVRKETTFYL